MSSRKTAPTIAMSPVKSSGIKAIGHDPATKTADVSPEEHASFLSAESIGQHFGKHFRSRTFERI